MTKKETKYYLVTFQSNWADEMDVEGGRIMTEKEKEKYFASIKKEFDEQGSYTYYIGTNQDINFDTYEELDESFSIDKISKEERKVLVKLGLDAYGFFPSDEYN